MSDILTPDPGSEPASGLEDIGLHIDSDAVENLGNGIYQVFVGPAAPYVIDGNIVTDKDALKTILDALVSADESYWDKNFSECFNFRNHALSLYEDYQHPTDVSTGVSAKVGGALKN